MTFFIVVFILIMQSLWLYIDDLVGKGLSIWVIFEFLGWGGAIILPMALPLATLLASIMTLGGMGENHELLAMKAAGLSLQRILYPLTFVSIAISIGAFFISNDLIPIAYNKIFTLQYDIGKTKDEIKIPTETFYNGIDGYTLRISERNPDTDIMYNIIIYDHSNNNGNTSIALADSGSLKSTPDKKNLILTLYNGTSYEEENTRKYKDTSFVLKRVDFVEQDVVIPLDNYSFEKSSDDRYGDEIMAKDLKKLRHDGDSIETTFGEISFNQERKFVYSTSLSKAIQLDTAKNKGFLEGGSLDLDSLYHWGSCDEEKDAIIMALSEIDNIKSIIDSYRRESYEYLYLLRRINLEAFRKFALSIACLIFFFIGAPLGAIIRKGGLGTPAIVSALFFVLYWVVDTVGKKLARDGAIDPFSGAFISSMILLPIGIFLTWKATKDSNLFNTDLYINAIKNFFNKTGVKKKRK